MHEHIEELSLKADEAVANLNRERSFRQHVQRILKKQERAFSDQ